MRASTTGLLLLPLLLSDVSHRPLLGASASDPTGAHIRLTAAPVWAVGISPDSSSAANVSVLYLRVVGGKGSGGGCRTVCGGGGGGAEGEDEPKVCGGGNATAVVCGGTFPLDLRSLGGEISFSFSAPAGTEVGVASPRFEVEFSATADCSDATYADGAQYVSGNQIRATVTGSSTQEIVAGYDSDRSFVQIRGGCEILTHLEFASEGGGSMAGSVSGIAWSAGYDEDRVAGGSRTYRYDPDGCWIRGVAGVMLTAVDDAPDEDVSTPPPSPAPTSAAGEDGVAIGSLLALVCAVTLLKSNGFRF